jgi:TRAP-type mannitol/chloroaromatic compound transport system permease large subunit
MSYEMIALLMFSSLMLLLFTGQRVFAAIGFVGAASAMALWGVGGVDIAFASAIKLMKWYPLLTLPMFIFMGYVLSESKIADDLYKMFHVWFGGLSGGLAVGTIGLDGADLGHERAVGGGYGHRCHHCPAGAAASRL